MSKRLKRLLLLSLSLSPSLIANQRVTIFCMQGGHFVVTSGIPSVTQVQQSYPTCTMTVYPAGSNTPVAGNQIFSDNMGTVKGNPFQADATGVGFFYAANGRYDVVLSGGQGGGFSAPYTIGDILLQDNAGSSLVNSVTGSSGVTCSPTTGAVNCTNTGVTSNVAGTGIGVSGATGAVTISNTGVTSIGAGSGISVNQATGAVTISATGGGGGSTAFETPLPWSQTPAGTISTGSNTVTLTPCPTGLNGTDTNHWISLSGSSSTINVQSCAPGTPITCTANGHGLSTGNFVTLNGPGYSSWAVGPWLVTNTGANSISLQNSSFSGAPLAMLQVYNSTPIVVVLGTVGLSTGDSVTIAGVTGTTNANGAQTITRLDDFTYQLNGTVGNGNWTGGGTLAFTGTNFGGGGTTMTYGPEADLITGGSCTSGAPSGTVTFTAKNPHSAGYTIGSATAGVDEAMRAGIAAGIQRVLIPPGTYTFQGGVTIPSNFTISGSGAGTTLITQAPGTPGISLFQLSGTLGTSTTTATTLSFANRACPTTANCTVTDHINFTSTVGFAQNNYVYMTSGIDATYGNFFSQVNPISYISGSTVWFKDPIGIPLDPTLMTPAALTLWTPTTNVTIQDLAMDGQALGLGRYTIGTNALFGIQLAAVARSSFRNLEFRNFTSSAAMDMTNGGYGNQFSQLTSRFSGSAGYNDLSFYFQTRAQVHDILSEDAYGFGPGFYYCTYCQGVNISVEKPAGRDMKFSGCAWCQVTNFIGHRSISNCVGVTQGTFRLMMSNVTCLENTNGEGLWFSGQDNEYNIINGGQLAANGLSFAPTDLTIAPQDLNNSIINVDMTNSVNYVDATLSNQLTYALPYYSQVYNSGTQSISNSTWTSLTWDTNVADRGPVHSTSVNPTRFTIPVPQGCVTVACGWTDVSASVSFANSATGNRGLRILKNSSVGLPGAAFVPAATGADNTTLNISSRVQLQDGDYFEIQVFQESGGNLNVLGGAGITNATVKRSQ